MYCTIIHMSLGTIRYTLMTILFWSKVMLEYLTLERKLSMYLKLEDAFTIN